MFIRIFVVSFAVLVGCGKVAQDISNQSNKSIFKEASFSFDFSSKKNTAWDSLASSLNVTSVYGYFNGLKLDQGFEKIGWVQAKVTVKDKPKTRTPFLVSNLDVKQNLVTTSRYQQGYISFQKISTHNFRTTTQFRKVRPKYDFYYFSHFLSKDTYVLFITDKIPTQSIKVTPYQHLVSAVYLKHLNQESYNRDTIIPLSFFYQIIPKNVVTPTLNITPKNTVKVFNKRQPLFILKSPLFDALLATVTLAHHSDKYDVIDYVKADKKIFSEHVKTNLIGSINSYFKSKKATVSTQNVTKTNDD